MWNWIKKLFTPKKEEIIVLKDENKIDLSKTTKGDRKKLYAQGKITAEQINKVQ
tara:strand:- start:254 stop:415 length:162 start_codon:yes stop_codon:yes gene_type:complete